MSPGGTARYRTATHVPPLVVRAAVLAYDLGFDDACLPEQGRLLRVLAAGRSGGRIGETGTGTGVGLAWMVSGADAATSFVSVERDEERATRAADLFADHPNVTVLHDDWRALLAHAPFDLLVLDGGGAGKDGGDPPDPAVALAPGGTLVVDDFTPSAEWPPTHDGAIDGARLHWLEHPMLSAAEVRTTADSVTIVASRRG
jgi:predicted O-methyltransferase YrrM